MKKLYVLALCMATIYTCKAQNVVGNKYGNIIIKDSIPVSTIDVHETSDKDLHMCTMGFMYYDTDGLKNYGYDVNYMTYNSFGFQGAFRGSFKEHGNINFDLGINYSYWLTHDENSCIALTIGVGPTIRMQDVGEPVINKQGTYVRTDYEGHIFVDAFFNPRLTIKYGRLSVFGGYFLWIPKFEWDYKTDGYHVGIGLAF